MLSDPVDILVGLSNTYAISTLNVVGIANPRPFFLARFSSLNVISTTFSTDDAFPHIQYPQFSDNHSYCNIHKHYFYCIIYIHSADRMSWVWHIYNSLLLYILSVAISCYIFRCDAIELYYSSRANYIAPSSPIYPTPKHTLMRTNCLVSPLSTTFQLVSYHMLYMHRTHHTTLHMVLTILFFLLYTILAADRFDAYLFCCM